MRTSYYSVVLNGADGESGEHRVCDICDKQAHEKPEVESHVEEPQADLQLSPWKVRELVGVWLERQAEHGRSKQLVPQLTMLEEALKARVGESATSNEDRD